MNLRRFNTCSGIFAATLMALVIMAAPQDSQATTFANTSVVNTVTLGYKSLGGANYTAVATVTVTVNLVPSIPTLDFISQNPLATSGSPTDELTQVTQNYRLTSTMNGFARYTVDSGIYGPTNISASTGMTAQNTNVYLGATNVGIQAASGATVIYVPLDTYTGTAPWTYANTTSTIGGANGIAVNDYVMINGQRIQVTAIDNSAGAYTGPNADYVGKFAKLTLGTALSAAVLPGDLVAETLDFAIVVTTGSLSAGQTTGNYTTTLKARTSDDNNEVINTDVNATIYVARCDLTITKAVSVNAGSSWTISTAGTNTTPGNATPVTADPQKELWYRITVTSANNGKNCKSVTVTDNLSPYVAFKMADVGILAVTTTGTGLTFTAGTTDTYLDQNNASLTPASTGGGAPANYDARVHQLKLDFGTTQMNANSSLIVNYRAWLF